ncbi:MAG: protein kinase [Proteobacteria bacterium]|nr:protein kinase [Pseudomonadota bacterium]
MRETYGPFRTERRVGVGASAEVWLARHATGTPVAIKVLKGGQQAWLARELRAIAGLSHRHIIQLFDWGGEDDPWLAMEFASGGTLADGGVLPWHLARSALLDLLDALAHTHARGIVHRDLKLANVLRCMGTDHRPGYKLSDFGQAVDRQSLRMSDAAGSLRSMAPEQFGQRVVDLGPWTDLYALGVLAHQLSTGVAPFEARTLDGWRHAHTQLPPRLQVPDGVPAGWADWLRNLLAKSPGDRFQRAADAAHALRALGEPAVDGALSGIAIDDDNATFVFDAVGEQPEPMTSVPEVSMRPALELPANWRRPPVQPPPRFPDAGLSLIGARFAQVAGHDEARDQLWAELGQVVESQTTRIVGLTGPGSMQLGQWLALRAEEAGIALAAIADEGPAALLRSQLQGQPAAEFLQRFGPSPPGLAERVEAVLDGEGTQDLAPVFHEVAHHCTSRRALVLVVEQSDAHARHLVRHVALARWVRRVPLLIVVVGGEGADATVRLGRVEVSAARGLVDQLLPLEPETREWVVRRSVESEIMPLEILRSLVDHGLLAPGQGGYRRTGLLPSQGRAANLSPEALAAEVDRRLDEGLLGQEQGRRADVERLLEELEAFDPDGAWQDEARTLAMRAWLATTRGEPALALTLAEQAVTGASSDRLRAKVLLTLAAARYRLQDHEGTREALTQSRQAARRAEDEGLQLVARLNEATVWNESRPEVWDAILLPLEDLGRYRQAVGGWYHRGKNAWAAGRVDEARTCIGRVLRLTEQSGLPGRFKAFSSHLQAEMAHEAGDTAGARAAYERSAETMLTLGIPDVVFVWLNLAMIAREQDRRRDARDLLLRALWTCTWRAMRRMRGPVHAWLAAIEGELGDGVASMEHLDQAIADLNGQVPDRETADAFLACAASLEASHPEAAQRARAAASRA